MGNTQQLELRNKQRSVRFSRVFQPATVALLVAIGASGCANTEKQVKAYEPPAAQRVAPAANTAMAASPEVVITAQRTDDKNIQVRADRPHEYVVVKGDTLWDISGKFLHDPFQWPSVWKQNPQIKNPHLIYPGDIIRLSVVDGRAVIDVLRPNGKGGYSSVAGGEAGAPRMRNGREVLSPQVHEEELIRSVSNRAAEAIRDFAKSPHVVATDELNNAAYVLSTTGGRLISANGDEIYARGFKGKMQETYSIYRPSTPLVDPDTGAILGYEAKRVADAKLTRGGDPVTLRLFNSTQETLKGDRLVPKLESVMDNPVPVAVDPNTSAKIISLYDSLAQAGQHQVVVINKGHNGGMQAGSVLEIASGHTAVFDEHANDGEGEYVELPERVKGNAIVFRAFDNVSYALILEAALPIKIGDTLRGF